MHANRGGILRCVEESDHVLDARLRAPLAGWHDADSYPVLRGLSKYRVIPTSLNRFLNAPNMIRGSDVLSRNSWFSGNSCRTECWMETRSGAAGSIWSLDDALHDVEPLLGEYRGLRERRCGHSLSIYLSIEDSEPMG